MINKIINYCRSKKFEIQITETEIFEFKKTDETATCRFRCSFCKKLIRCNYVSHWRANNLELHLLEHIKKAPPTQQQPNSALNQPSNLASNQLQQNAASCSSQTPRQTPMDSELARILNKDML